ncbi:MAG: LacI family DNA-binding transcriptional regulator [Chloroflexota bacterium]
MNLEEIAQLAGVSRATVSRVINKHPYVSEAVRQRVLEIIEREGFHPNAAARMLARQRTEVIGVIAPEGLEPIFLGGYFPVLLGGISSAISHSDYVMSLWAGSTAEEAQRMYKRILGYKLMDGAVLISSIQDDTLPRSLYERRMPLVMIGPTIMSEVSTVDIDNLAAARVATDHLIRLGRRRIAHITGRHDIIAVRQRFDGYRTALEASQIPFDPALVDQGDFTENSGYFAARKFIPLGIDAIFASNDLMAIGAMRGLAEQGLNVPDDVAVVGFDDMHTASTLHPALTTMRQPIRELGSIATHMLIDIIQGKVTPPHRIVLPTELVIRETCGAIPRSG